MRKLGYLLIFVILGSCMNNKDANRESAVPMMVEESDDLFDYDIKNTNFSITSLAQQKLQEYYDLSLLQKHHPEFESDIKLQLNKLSDTLLILPNTTREITIKNVTEIDYQKVTDSTSKLRLRYEAISDRGNTFDTISAIIKTKTIMVNNETITTHKLSFINK